MLKVQIHSKIRLFNYEVPLQNLLKNNTKCASTPNSINHILTTLLLDVLHSNIRINLNISFVLHVNMNTCLILFKSHFNRILFNQLIFFLRRCDEIFHKNRKKSFPYFIKMQNYANTMDETFSFLFLFSLHFFLLLKFIAFH